MLLRILAAFILGLAVLVVFVAPASSIGRDNPVAATTTTISDLPGTTLEAQQRDDGNTSPAPWLIGSALAAALSIGVGGTILKRHQS